MEFVNFLGRNTQSLSCTGKITGVTVGERSRKTRRAVRSLLDPPLPIVMMRIWQATSKDSDVNMVDGAHLQFSTPKKVLGGRKYQKQAKEKSIK
jgi:hypothetical protein